MNFKSYRVLRLRQGNRDVAFEPHKIAKGRLQIEVGNNCHKLSELTGERFSVAIDFSLIGFSRKNPENDHLKSFFRPENSDEWRNSEHYPKFSEPNPKPPK